MAELSEVGILAAVNVVEFLGDGLPRSRIKMRLCVYLCCEPLLHSLLNEAVDIAIAWPKGSLIKQANSIESVLNMRLRRGRTLEQSERVRYW